MSDYPIIAYIESDDSSSYAYGKELNFIYDKNHVIIKMIYKGKEKFSSSMTLEDFLSIAELIKERTGT